MCNFAVNSHFLSHRLWSPSPSSTMPTVDSPGVCPFLAPLHFLLLLFWAWRCERETVLYHDWLWQALLVALAADLQGDPGTVASELSHCQKVLNGWVEAPSGPRGAGLEHFPWRWLAHEGSDPIFSATLFHPQWAALHSPHAIPVSLPLRSPALEPSAQLYFSRTMTEGGGLDHSHPKAQASPLLPPSSGQASQLCSSTRDCLVVLPLLALSRVTHLVTPRNGRRWQKMISLT